jgi:RNA polymerase sigma factor (sigma-70 family)
VAAGRRSQGAGFDAFYRQLRPRLLRTMLLTLDDQDLAVDATDEALARAFQRWSTVSDYKNPDGWAYRVALNWARSRLRKRHTEGTLQGAADQRPSNAADATIDPALDRAVRMLPIKLRTVVVLRYYLDWSTEEAAKALRVPKGTVKSRLHRALRQLAAGVEMEQ